jgi:hypothetical protein
MLGQCALITVLWMEPVIYVALELVSAVKPRASANEDVTVKPFRTVIARGRTVVRSDVIVTIGTFGSYSDVDADLSFCFGDGSGEADSSHRR